MRIQCQPLEAAVATLFHAPHTVLVVGATKGDRLAALDDVVPAEWAHELKERCAAEGFVGAFKQQLVLRLPTAETGLGRGAAIVCLGLGPAGELAAARWLRLAGMAARLGKSLRAERLALCLPGMTDARTPPLREALLVAQGLALGLYRFGECRAPAKGEDGALERAPREAHLLVQTSAAAQATWLAECNDAVTIGQTVAEAVIRARTWVNLPANLLGPAEFAQAAQKEAKAAGLACQVLDEAALRKEGMGMLLGVGQGSERPPRLVHVRYEGPGAARSQPIVLVGKGILFDSGGLCLKPCDGMATMKMDMGGAACVLAVIGAAARLGLPVHVHALLALAENMPSGHAIRPGDILTSMSGKTVEVNNTDAEGRLVLGDAMTYAQRLKPAALVDVATLTGACMVALGPTTAGLFANDEALAEQLLGAAGEAGEDAWRLPLTPSLREQLKSDCADLRNTGERYGGAITAALFLKEFAGEQPWAHFDIAGPAWGSEDGGHLSKGGTGAAVATLLRFLMLRSQGGEGRAAARQAPAKPQAARGARRAPRRARGG